MSEVKAANVGGLFSRLAALASVLSHVGIHGLAGVRALGHLSTVYETLAKAKGSDQVTLAEFQAALTADPSTHPFLDMILQYLPFIMSILASLFHFPIPPLPIPAE
jgi:hypothetical protein